MFDYNNNQAHYIYKQKNEIMQSPTCHSMCINIMKNEFTIVIIVTKSQSVYFTGSVVLLYMAYKHHTPL